MVFLDQMVPIATYHVSDCIACPMPDGGQHELQDHLVR
jgi:hypothetical protein